MQTFRCNNFMEVAEQLATAGPVQWNWDDTPAPGFDSSNTIPSGLTGLSGHVLYSATPYSGIIMVTLCLLGNIDALSLLHGSCRVEIQLPGVHDDILHAWVNCLLIADSANVSLSF